jgi:hypothetical protein
MIPITDEKVFDGALPCGDDMVRAKRLQGTKEESKHISRN